MSKSLGTLQTLAKVARVLSTIVFVCSIIGIALLALAEISIFIIDPTVIVNELPADIRIMIGSAVGRGALSIILGISAVGCVGALIMSKQASEYFGNVVHAGTPFTKRGAREMKRLGLICLLTSIGVGLAEGILNLALSLISGTGWDGASYIEVSADISIGIAFLVVSVLLKYGAELEERSGQNDKI